MDTRKRFKGDHHRTRLQIPSEQRRSSDQSSVAGNGHHQAPIVHDHERARIGRARDCSRGLRACPSSGTYRSQGSRPNVRPRSSRHRFPRRGSEKSSGGRLSLIAAAEEK